MAVGRVGVSQGEREREHEVCTVRGGWVESVSLPVMGETTEWEGVESVGLRGGDGIYLGCGRAAGSGGWGWTAARTR